MAALWFVAVLGRQVPEGRPTLSAGDSPAVFAFCSHGCENVNVPSFRTPFFPKKALEERVFPEMSRLCISVPLAVLSCVSSPESLCPPMVPGEGEAVVVPGPVAGGGVSVAARRGPEPLCLQRRETQSPGLVTPRRAGAPGGVLQGQKQKGLVVLVSGGKMRWPCVKNGRPFLKGRC